MTTFYYQDANGQKLGPVNDQQLKALAVQGVIAPQTPLETEAGHKGQAGQIKGLFPESPAPNPFTEPAIQGTVPVPIGKSRKPLILAGGIAVLLVILVGGMWLVSALSPPVSAEQKLIDNFCEAFGTDVHAVDEDGGTLLHLAAVGPGSLPIVKYLVSKGADVNATADGVFPLDVATDSAVIEYLTPLTNKSIKNREEPLVDDEQEFSKNVVRMTEVTDRLSVLETGFGDKYGYRDYSASEKKLEHENLTKERLELRKKIENR